jgi:hypothetical protein
MENKHDKCLTCGSETKKASGKWAGWLVCEKCETVQKGAVILKAYLLY